MMGQRYLISKTICLFYYKDLNAVGDDIDGIETRFEIAWAVVGHFADCDARRVDFEVKVRQRSARFEVFSQGHHLVDGFAGVLDAPKTPSFPLAQELDAESGRKSNRLLTAFNRHGGGRRSFVADLVGIFVQLFEI